MSLSMAHAHAHAKSRACDERDRGETREATRATARARTTGGVVADDDMVRMVVMMMNAGRGNAFAMPHHAYDGATNAIERARIAARVKARACALASAGRVVREYASIANGDHAPGATHKQWPIVPQVSTAVCPPRSTIARSAPGEFRNATKTWSSGKREAVNAGVQEANCAKSKAKTYQAMNANERNEGACAKASASGANVETTVDANARATRRESSSRLESLDDRPSVGSAAAAAAAAIAAAAVAEAEMKHRVDEAKALLDPAMAIDRATLFAANANANANGTTRSKTTRAKRSRSERSNAPSPESSRDVTDDTDERDLLERNARASVEATTGEPPS